MVLRSRKSIQDVHSHIYRRMYGVLTRTSSLFYLCKTQQLYISKTKNFLMWHSIKEVVSTSSATHQTVTTVINPNNGQVSTSTTTTTYSGGAALVNALTRNIPFPGDEFWRNQADTVAKAQRQFSRRGFLGFTAVVGGSTVGY